MGDLHHYLGRGLWVLHERRETVPSVSSFNHSCDRNNRHNRMQQSWTMEELLGDKELISNQEYCSSLALDPAQDPGQRGRRREPRQWSQRQAQKTWRSSFFWGSRST
ncbi:hypothetical protein DPEC_G00166760 [Dallia pectoralis]|uniref:Uncharacterized protein n=1 Tax=Dallia pectoralis TaxID=75939 RepID=A0ACC2GHN2_DALPE|nr:hypothetical protein DPEC_G00166760 [Dallia pectoralis]